MKLDHRKLDILYIKNFIIFLKNLTFLRK